MFITIPKMERPTKTQPINRKDTKSKMLFPKKCYCNSCASPMLYNTSFAHHLVTSCCSSANVSSVAGVGDLSSMHQIVVLDYEGPSKYAI